MFTPFGKLSRAKRNYLKGGAMVMAAYIFTVLGCTSYVRNHPLQSTPRLILLAAVPSLPIFAFLGVVARYLREETDEFLRDLVVRSMLWGTATVLAITTFTSFLRSYGWHGRIPPFTEFTVFWAAAAIAKMIYKFRNRVAVDD